MKTMPSMLTSMALIFTHVYAPAQRYLSPVFDEVTGQEDVVYGANYTIITIPFTGHSTLQELKMDVYTPAGDHATDRPLVLFFHRGNLLPIQTNFQTTGTKTDSAAVEICTRLARMGYVVASVDYRLGWNPYSIDVNVIVGTMAAAVYRGVQDARTCIRYFRKTLAEEGNPFGICGDWIALMGDGQGGAQIALTASLTGGYLDWVIPKLIGPDINGDGVPDPFILQPVHGDPNGEELIGLHPLNGDTLAIPNHPGYSSDANLCVNFGGAIFDTTWVDGSDPPVISYHVPNDPLLPYQDGWLINHPGTLIIELHGSYRVAQKANLLGSNQVFKDANINDIFTTAANLHNDGHEGLFPFLRPTWDFPLSGSPTYESSPWVWWDEVYWSQQEHPTCMALGLPLSDCNFHLMNWYSQQDMSHEKGRTYIDSIIGYFAPRAYATLDIGGPCFTGTKERESGQDVTVFPNPASDAVTLAGQQGQPILGIWLYNLSGQLVKQVEGIHGPVQTLNLEGLASGLYIVRVQFREGVFSKKVILQGGQ